MSFSNFYSQHVLDTHGRKLSLYMSSILSFAGCGIQALAYVVNRYQLLVVGRILVGMGTGQGVSSQIVLISEIAPTSIRGTAGSRYINHCKDSCVTSSFLTLPSK